MWTWEQKMSTQCRNLKHCGLNPQCFHELDILNFLKKELFWYVVICLKMEENIKRKDWDKVAPKTIFSGNGLKNVHTVRKNKTVWVRLLLRWCHCSDQTWTKVCDRLRLVSRRRIVKSNEGFVNYWLKHDGMIVRIQVHVYLSSLLLALMSKFHFANILIAV